jgi:hypothetical protein
MRRLAAVAVALLALLASAGALAGCSGDDGPVQLGVTTSPASATAGSAGGSPSAGRTPPPAPTGSPATVPGSPLATFQALAADWQRARSAFFATVSGGRPLTVAQQRAQASALLAAQRRFATRLQAVDWPGVGQLPVAALIGRNRGQQASIAAMAAAGSKGEFAARLAEYGVNVGPENQAVIAVARALR